MVLSILHNLATLLSLLGTISRHFVDLDVSMSTILILLRFFKSTVELEVQLCA